MLPRRGLLRLRKGFVAMLVVECRFRGARGLEKLRAGAGGLADKIPLGMAPMGGHLASPRAGVVLRTNGLKKCQRCDTEHEAESAGRDSRDRASPHRDAREGQQRRKVPALHRR